MSLLLTNTQGKAFVINANDTTVPYQRVEYLESTGDGEYIQTPIKTVRDSRFVIDAEFVSTSVNYYYILGDATGTSAFRVVLGIGKSRNQYYSQCGSGTGYVYFGTVNTSRHVFDIQNGAQSGQTILLDDTQYTSSYALSSDSQTGLKLFGYNTSVGAIKIYELKVYESDVLVLDYIPVRVGNVGYMYDRVSGQLFGNAGTGDFVIGPDMPSNAITLANDYVTDGLTHWWDGIYKGGVSNIWKDLVGDIDLQAQGVRTNSYNSWILSGGYLISPTANYIDEGYDSATIEAVFRVDSITSGKTVFIFVSGPNTTEKPIMAIDSNDNVILGDKKSRPTYKITDWKGKPQRVSLTYGGCLINCTTPAAGTSTYKNNNNNYTYVGKRSGSYSDNTAFIGEVYCVRVYNRRLTAAEMLHNQLVDEFRFGLWDRPIVQLLQNGDFSDGVIGWSAGYRCSRSVSDGVMTVKKTSTAGHIVAQHAIQLSGYHKYYFHYEAKLSTSTTGNIYAGQLKDPAGTIGTAFDKSILSDWTTVTMLGSSGTALKEILATGAYAASTADYLAVGDTVEMRNIYLIDLTLTFGEGNEPDIDLCRKMFTKDYYPYYNPNE